MTVPPHSGESTSRQLTDYKKKRGFMKAMMEKTQFIAQNPDVAQSLAATIKKRNKKRPIKKTLTVSTPFNLRTEKRIRLDLIGQEGD